MLLLQYEYSSHMPVIGTLFPGLEKVMFHPDPMPVAGCVTVALVMLVCVVRLIIHGNLLRRAAAADAKFTEGFRNSAHALALFQNGDCIPGSPRNALYTNACRELAFHLLGSDAVDKNFALKLRTAGRITPSQWEATQRAARRSLDESARWLRAGLAGWVVKSLLGLGFLGSLLSLMEHGAADVIDPLALVSSLRPLALALLCHVIGMAWHRRLMRDAEDAEAGVKDFSTELGMLFERSFVDHRHPIETLPSLQGMGIADGPTFSLAPAESARAGVK